MDYGDADLLLRSLGDAGRRQVARILAETPLTVGEISDVLGLPQSTVSRHLKTLRATGLLVERREGSRVYIGLTEPASNGEGGLAGLLNAWLRRQPLASPLQSRLRQTVESRSGDVNGFDRLAHQWDDLRFAHFGGVFHMEAVASLLPRTWRVLDIGTGTGYMLPFLARHFSEVIAADASSAMLELARQRADREGLSNVRFKLGRLEDLPVEDASVDCAVAVLVLRHSANLDQSSAELARALKEGGRLVIVDVCRHAMDDFRRRIGDASDGLEPEDVVLQLERAGFQGVERRPLPTPPSGTPAAPSRPAPELFLIVAERGPRVQVERRRKLKAR